MTEPPDIALSAPFFAAAPNQPPVPHFDVRLAPPDLSPWLAGNAGVPGFITRDSGRPGPHVVLVGLMHGNELAGGIVLDMLLRADLRPKSGRLTMGFANIAAFARFDPAQPTASRFLDEDLNRLWDPAMLDGPRTSCELGRARELRPLIETADVLLDLHSMLWPSDPLILSGTTSRGRDLASAAGVPALVVADGGHISGPRLIDYRAFTGPGSRRTAVLVEAGQHWEPATVTTTLGCIAGVLRHLDVVDDHAALPPPPPPPQPPVRFAQVTMAVTASTARFAFVQQFRGGDVVARRNTMIAVDGEAEIRTPHDNCLMVMPSLRPSRGHTAVRLARFAG
jgi:predicted deacylase